MNTVDTSQLRRAASAVYLACPQSVALDISIKLSSSADEIDKLRAENELLRSQVTRLQVDDPAFDL